MTQPTDQVKTTPLPAGLKWFDVLGQVLFPCYSQSGLVTTRMRSVLVQQMPQPDDGDFGDTPWTVIEKGAGRWVNLDFYVTDSAELVREKIDKAIRLLVGENHA